ncbi:MAG: DUF1015 family protein [Bacilli bacterium]
MELKKIEDSFLNVSGNIYDSEFINLVNIQNDKIALDDNTVFLSDNVKDDLNSNIIENYQNCVYVFEHHGIYGIVCDVPIEEYNKGNIRNHELVIPETVQGMLSNFYGYNGEAAPTLLLHENKIDLRSITNKKEYVVSKKIGDINIFVYEGKIAEEILENYGKINNMFIGDGHHRMYTTSLTEFKGKVLSCIVSIEYISLLPIHRKLKEVSEDEFIKALEFIKNKFSVEECLRSTKVEKGFVKLIFKNDCFLIKLIDLNSDAFWNNDVYRLNTQIINQAFRIFDFSRVNYLSPFEKFEKLNNDLILELSELPRDEFINAAESNSILPPKSTWMSYKFPSLLIMSLYQ